MHSSTTYDPARQENSALTPNFPPPPGRSTVPPAPHVAMPENATAPKKKAEEKPIPPGRYLCDLTSGRACKAAKTDNTGFVFEFVVIGSQRDLENDTYEDDEYKGRRIYARRWIKNPGSREREVKNAALLAALGASADDRWIMPGHSCWVDVVIAENQDYESKNEVVDFEPLWFEPHVPEGFEPKPVVIDDFPLRNVTFGLLSVGPNGERFPTDAEKIFTAFCRCEPPPSRSDLFLSAYDYGPDIQACFPDKRLRALAKIDRGVSRLLASAEERAGRVWSMKSHRGVNGASWIWWDIDDDDLEVSLKKARRLVQSLLKRYETLKPEEILVFFSGKKGYHVGVPTALFGAGPSLDFVGNASNFTLHFAETGAKLATPVKDKNGNICKDKDGKTVTKTTDPSMYIQGKLFRAPNSFHPSGRRYKIRLTTDELARLTTEEIRELAKSRRPFEPPSAKRAPDQTAVHDWKTAPKQSKRSRIVKGSRGAEESPTLGKWLTERLVEDFPIGEGERHRTHYIAALKAAIIASKYGVYGLVEAYLKAFADKHGPEGFVSAMLNQHLQADIPDQDKDRNVECGFTDAENL